MSERLSISPLTCAGCGGTVPLLDESAVCCPHCGDSVSVPSDYRRWRAEKQAGLAAQEALLDLHKSLGKTPNALEQFIVFGTNPGCCSGCLLAYFTMALGGLFLGALIKSLNFVTRLIPAVATTRVPGAEVLITLIVVSPYFLAFYLLARSLLNLRKRVKTLTYLQSQLVAAPPKHEGGQASCRQCGATLEVEDGKLTATCYYCCSHNLVSLDARWVEKLRAYSADTSLTLRQATEVYTAEEKQGHGRAIGCLVGLVVFAAMMFSGVRDEKNYEPAKVYPEPEALILEGDLMIPRLSTPSQGKLYLDTRTRRFRRNEGALIFLGNLKSPEKMTIISPDSRRYLVYDDENIARLEKSFGSAAGARYRDAWRSYEDFRLRELSQLVETPCQSAAAVGNGKHPVCTHRQLEGNVQEWTHPRAKGDPLVQRYDTRLGVMVSTPWGCFLKDPAVRDDLSDAYFEVPKDYKDAFSDETAANQDFDFLGTATMIPGMKMTRFMSKLADDPPPPRSALWTYQSEEWTPPQKQIAAVVISRVHGYRDWDPISPPESYDKQLIKVDHWDATPVVGKKSFQPTPTYIIFSDGTDLFSVGYTTDFKTKTPVTDIAKLVLARARQRAVRAPSVK